MFQFNLTLVPSNSVFSKFPGRGGEASSMLLLWEMVRYCIKLLTYRVIRICTLLKGPKARSGFVKHTGGGGEGGGETFLPAIPCTRS